MPVWLSGTLLTMQPRSLFFGLCASLNHFVVSHARHAPRVSMRHRNGATRWPRGRGYPTQPNPMPHKHTQPIPTQSDLAQFDPSQFSPIRPSRTRSNPTQRTPTSAQPHPNPTEPTPTHPSTASYLGPAQFDPTRSNPIGRLRGRVAGWSLGWSVRSGQVTVVCLLRVENCELEIASVVLALILSNLRRVTLMLSVLDWSHHVDGR